MVLLVVEVLLLPCTGTVMPVGTVCHDRSACGYALLVWGQRGQCAETSASIDDSYGALLVSIIGKARELL